MDGVSGKSSISRVKRAYFRQHGHWQTQLADRLKPSLTSEQVVHRVTEAEIGDQSEPEPSVKTCLISVILPIYNEQSCIHRTFDAVLDYCQSHPSYTFIFVSDGSTDLTRSILEHRIQQSETIQIRLLAYEARGGKGHAVKRGMEVADGDYLCFLDGDLAYSLDHLDRLVAKLEHFDVVIGCRSLAPRGNRGLSPTRKLAGKVFNSLSTQILNLDFVDMQAGLKGFRKNAARTLFRKQFLRGFSFDVELIYLAKKFRCTIAEIPAHVSGNHAAKVSKVNLLLDSLKMFFDLFKIRFYDFMRGYE